jgi:hypothetical protein
VLCPTASLVHCRQSSHVEGPARSSGRARCAPPTLFACHGRHQPAARAGKRFGTNGVRERVIFCFAAALRLVSGPVLLCSRCRAPRGVPRAGGRVANWRSWHATRFCSTSRLTASSSGQPTAGLVQALRLQSCRRCLPLMSNVRLLCPPHFSPSGSYMSLLSSRQEPMCSWFRS